MAMCVLVTLTYGKNMEPQFLWDALDPIAFAVKYCDATEHRRCHLQITKHTYLYIHYTYAHNPPEHWWLVWIMNDWEVRQGNINNVWVCVVMLPELGRIPPVCWRGLRLRPIGSMVTSWHWPWHWPDNGHGSSVSYTQLITTHNFEEIWSLKTAMGMPRYVYKEEL